MIALVTAQAVAFWLLAPVMVVGACGMVVSRKAVHSALWLALVMVCLAVQYAALDAPFLFVVQIIVYTGAILMLFLFVVMLIGVDTTDSIVETLKGHRLASILAVLGVAGLLIFGVGGAIAGRATGLDAANEVGPGNVASIAQLIFTRWVLPFEATSALLIVAAVGAMVLAHGEPLWPKVGQKERLQRRMRDYSESGAHLGPLPSSGVFARHNAISTPALLPDGSVADASVSKTLAARGAIIEADDLRAPTDAAYKAIESGSDEERPA